jgi:hypothetical protein
LIDLARILIKLVLKWENPRQGFSWCDSHPPGDGDVYMLL